MVKLRTSIWGKAKGDEVVDDDDHDYDEDADQCWYLGVSRGERGKNAKEDNSCPSQFAEDEDVGILV